MKDSDSQKGIKKSFKELVIAEWEWLMGKGQQGSILALGIVLVILVFWLQTSVTTPALVVQIFGGRILNTTFQPTTITYATKLFGQPPAGNYNILVEYQRNSVPAGQQTFTNIGDGAYVLNTFDNTNLQGVCASLTLSTNFGIPLERHSVCYG